MKKLLLLLSLFITTQLFGAVVHVKSQGGSCNSGTGFASACNGATTKTFTYTASASNANEGVLFLVGCSCASTTNTFTLTATGWTITQVGSAAGVSGSRVAVFKAYAPNTSLTTFTLSTSVANGNFYDALIDEFSGVDATNFVDASSLSTGAGCGGSVTPVASNDGIWFACNDSVTATAAPYTTGADDLAQDVAEWKILSGGAGAAQSPSYTSSGTASWGAVAIKPAVGGAVVRHRAWVIV
jgi:hypothetical protein